jgi:hypothetical protein
MSTTDRPTRPTDPTADLFELIGEHTCESIAPGDYIDSRAFVDARDFAAGELADALETADPSAALPAETADAYRRIIAGVDAIELESGSDFPYGEQYIPADSFEQYARELADDLGALPADRKDGYPNWPVCHIDWPAAARALAEDYAELTIDGVEYLTRNC